MYNRLPPLASFCAAAALAFVLSAGSCVDTDVGMPCNLQRNYVLLQPPPAGCEGVQPSQQLERPECFNAGTPNRQDLLDGPEKEYVSFGAAECDNLTCVRTAGDEVPSVDGEPDGYCSGECITDADCATEDGGKYECRELFLDQEFLRQLEQALSPDEYAQYFGRIKNAKFCARK